MWSNMAAVDSTYLAVTRRDCTVLLRACAGCLRFARQVSQWEQLMPGVPSRAFAALELAAELWEMRRRVV
jgi:predicted Fe-S protein YdhL (DUF1289 family)